MAPLINPCFRVENVGNLGELLLLEPLLNHAMLNSHRAHPTAISPTGSFSALPLTTLSALRSFKGRRLLILSNSMAAMLTSDVVVPNA